MARSGETTRRAFLKGVAALGAGLAADRAPGEGPARPEPAARVVDLRCAGWRRGRRPDPAVVERMINAALRALTGKTSEDDAWRAFFSPRDRIAIKFNSVSGDFTGANQIFVHAIARRLEAIGVPRRNMFAIEAVRARLPGSGEPDLTPTGEVKVHDRTTRLRRLLTDQIDAIIDVPNLKDHDRAGFTGALKNVAFAGKSFMTNPSQLHANGCDPYVATLYAMKPMREKNRLVVFNALLGIYENGPVPISRVWQWPHNGVLVATDPVAVDTVALELIERQRAIQRRRRPRLRARLRSLWDFPTRPPIHIRTAARMELGVGDLDRIDWAIEEMKA